MKVSRVRLAVASLVLALGFLLLDIYDVNFMLGETRVAIYPVAFFALVGVVLLLRPLLNRSRKPEPTRKPSV
jgi:hypothetical protein